VCGAETLHHNVGGQPAGRLRLSDQQEDAGVGPGEPLVRIGLQEQESAGQI